MSVEEALGRMRLLLARRSVVARRLAAAADGPGEVRSPRLDGMPRGHGTRGGTLAVLGRMEALADECAEIEGELRALSARVEGPILALPPGPHRLVMRLRYLEWRAVSDVANGAGYERRYTYKLPEAQNVSPSRIRRGGAAALQAYSPGAVEIFTKACYTTDRQGTASQGGRYVLL